MALDKIQCIQQLKMLKAYEEREYNLTKKAKSRHIKPSERAYAMALHSMNIEALQMAINEMERNQWPALR